MMDPDVHLFDHLIAGVPTGFQQDIPLSMFPDSCGSNRQLPHPPSVHQTNWKTARELVQAEVMQVG